MQPMTVDGFKWRATLDDGTVVKQVDDDGNKNGYEDLPHDRLRVFELYSGTERMLRVLFNKGEKLIWRRRVEMTPGQNVVDTCHIVGKRSKDGTGVIGIFESDGHIEMVEDFLPNHAWFYPPQFRPFEV